MRVGRPVKAVAVLLVVAAVSFALGYFAVMRYVG